MRIHIKTDIGYRGVELPRQFRLDGREVEVIENVDQWQDCDYRYFKVKGDDGNLYILRFNEGRADWELFQNPSSADRQRCRTTLGGALWQPLVPTA